MTSGGARGRSGPAPDPNALRRDRKSDAAGWIELPQECTDPAPEWPLGKSTEREGQLWADLWAMPQAKMWHQMRLEYEVALYTRYAVEAEAPDAKAAVRTLVRQHQDSLGLSTAGLARLRWRIVTDQVAEKREENKTRSRAARNNERGSMRDRLKAIDGGA